MKHVIWITLLPFLVSEPYRPPPIPLHVYYFPAVFSPPNKAGLAWAHRGQNDVSGLGISFYQDWLVLPENPIPGYERVQHLACRYWPYDATEETAETDYLADLTAIQPYSDTMLFLNEPDLPSEYEQCKMTPAEAVTLFREALEICPACKFTLPQVSHWDSQANWLWTREFIEVYQKQEGALPPATYGAFHVYNMAITPVVDSYTTMLQGAGYTAGLPILVTEVGACEPEQATAMLNELESDERIERYFWYSPAGGTCTDLFAGLGSDELTAVGWAFKGRNER